MKCSRELPCVLLHTLMDAGKIKFTEQIQLPDHPNERFSAMFIEGNLVHRADDLTGEKRGLIDAIIIEYCPGCGIRFDRMIDSYAPPLVIERTKPKPSLLTLM